MRVFCIKVKFVELNFIQRFHSTSGTQRAVVNFMKTSKFNMQLYSIVRRAYKVGSRFQKLNEIGRSVGDFQC